MLEAVGAELFEVRKKRKRKGEKGEKHDFNRAQQRREEETTE